MRFTMPVLAVVVAAILVRRSRCSRSRQTQSAIKFQLGEVIEEINAPGLHFKLPIVQNVKYFDRRNLTLDIPEPDRVTTSEKKPLLVEFVVLWRINDVRRFYVSVGATRKPRAAA